MYDHRPPVDLPELLVDEDLLDDRPALAADLARQRAAVQAAPRWPQRDGLPQRAARARRPLELGLARLEHVADEPRARAWSSSWRESAQLRSIRAQGCPTRSPRPSIRRAARALTALEAPGRLGPPLVPVPGSTPARSRAARQCDVPRRRAATGRDVPTRVGPGRVPLVRQPASAKVAPTGEQASSDASAAAVVQGRNRLTGMALADVRACVRDAPPCLEGASGRLWLVLGTRPPGSGSSGVVVRLVTKAVAPAARGGRQVHGVLDADTCQTADPRRIGRRPRSRVWPRRSASRSASARHFEGDGGGASCRTDRGPRRGRSRPSRP